MDGQRANITTISRLLFRLLPAQILLSGVGAVNGLVSGFFATNYVGIDAMSAVGLYAPLNMLITSVTTVLVGGCAILCGKYMGRNEQDKMQNVFSLNLVLSLLVAIVFILVYSALGLFDLTGFLTRDAEVRRIFNQYILGMAIGTVPLVLGSSLASFLAIENKGRRTVFASLIYIAANILLNFIFVQVLSLEAFGLALASSLGLWIFFFVQAETFLSGRTHLRMRLRGIRWADTFQIFKIGLPGAISNIYQTARGLIVNHLLDVYIGSAGLSSFAASNSLLTLIWAIPGGMIAVSRLMISVSVGEEDRQTLTDVMRVMFRRFLPLMGAVIAALILGSVPLTRIFYQNPAEPVFMMTVWGFRILPLCMPFSIIYMHFTCYCQTSGRQVLAHLEALLDGVVCVAGFTALLIPWTGILSVYIANILNGVVTVGIFFIYAWVKNRHVPRNLEELMVIPPQFGALPEERLDFSVRSPEDVVAISERIQAFCLARGVSSRSAYLAGLSMEEMAGNVVDHGFRKDNKKHSVDVRVVHKNDAVLLRIKDDCVPFDPGERRAITDTDDPAKNIGIRMIFKMAEDVNYQNILGLNVLTVKIPDR